MRSRFGSAMLVACVSLAACAGSDPVMSMHLPDWSGPGLSCAHRPDGAMTVEMTVPTGGHQLTLVDVGRDGAAATGRVDYAPPTGDMVPQVITTLRVEVPAERLGDATAVLVEVRAAGGDRPHLAVATSRPRR